MAVTLAVDCMGGDHGPSVTVPAVLSFLARDPEVVIILVGREDVLRPLIAGKGFADRMRIQHASEVVAMDDSPSLAMRNKKDSSMRVAVNLVKQGDAQAAVSAGNTGALMAISRFVLKTLPGIDRPAIASVLPSMKGETYVLDLGANVDCGPEHLLQFGIMGATLASVSKHIERPSVGLLNIGEEEIKGNEVVKQAAELLRRSGLNFYGNVEGNDIFKTVTDVVVCDGFVGNVALKASEGVAQMMSTFLRQEFERNVFTRLGALLVLPILKSFKKRLDPRLYNGASLLGLRGIVLKSHGSADVVAFENALFRAAAQAREGLVERVSKGIAEQLQYMAAQAAEVPKA